jgi:hypothetical protein
MTKLGLRKMAGITMGNNVVQKEKCCRSKEFGPDTGLYEKSEFELGLYEKI